MSFDPKSDDATSRDATSDDAANFDAKIDRAKIEGAKIGGAKIDGAKMEDSRKDQFSRRGFLGVGSAALAAGMLSNAAGQNSKQDSKPAPPPYPTKGDKNSSAPGPGNPAIDAQNPDSFLPPQTDAGCRLSSIPSEFRTSACRKGDGRARSRCASCRFRNQSPASTCD
jgi:hypothetical protein